MDPQETDRWKEMSDVDRLAARAAQDKEAAHALPRAVAFVFLLLCLLLTGFCLR